MPLRRNGPRATKILVLRPPSPLASHPFITKNILRDPPSSSGIWHFPSFLLLLGDSIAPACSLATLRRARLHGFWSAAGDPRPARDPPTSSGIWHSPSFLLLLGDSIAPECSLATVCALVCMGSGPPPGIPDPPATRPPAAESGILHPFCCYLATRSLLNVL